MEQRAPERRCEGRFFGRRVNCECVPALPAWAVRWALDDPRRIPYLFVWKSPWDSGVKEAVRVICLDPPSYLPEADSVEVKRTDGSAAHLRVLRQPLPRNGGHDILLACPCCCALRRALYGWQPGGEYTCSAQRSQWQCRTRAGLRYASEGGALLIRCRGRIGRLFGTGRAPRPEPWEPLIFTRPEQAAEVGLCRT